MTPKRLFFFFTILYSFNAMADGLTIDKVYLPYVQPLEKELEYRLTYGKNPETNERFYLNKLGFGFAYQERFFSELYIIVEDEEGSNASLEAYEFETRIQLTEQGEYMIDWGAIIELEKEHHINAWEAKLGLSMATDINNFTLASNVFLISEQGADIDNEVESSFSFQTLYRMRPTFEPGFEYYKSQDTHAIGPVISGVFKGRKATSTFWHLGAIFGLDQKTPDATITFHLEYEFY